MKQQTIDSKNGSEKHDREWFLDRVHKRIISDPSLCKFEGFKGEMQINDSSHANRLFNVSQNQGYRFSDL